jgi:metallo-beta-lactamase family protein
MKENNPYEYNDENWFLDSVYQKKSILPKNISFKVAKAYDMQMILFSASGDMDKGKSKQLAPIMLFNENVFVMIVNYISPTSLAGLLLQNKDNYFCGKKVAAKIKKYESFSDHADFGMLQRWLSKQSKTAKIYIIHSNKENTDQVVKLLREKGWNRVESAKLGETINFNFKENNLNGNSMFKTLNDQM